MSLTTILALALALAMDAFAVALASSVVLRRVSGRQYFRLAFHFGLFQFLMPVIGWLAGSVMAGWLEAVDHWVAFGLLAFIGGKMIHEALKKEKPDKAVTDPTKGLTLVALSVATSIDAFAVGLSLALLDVSIWYPCVVIGLVAAAMTLIGLRIGSRLGARFGRGMEIIGGLALIAIGARILIEHLWA
ncbi:MAG: manganese efflux pump MntP family protein [Pseudomonadota bacterium]